MSAFAPAIAELKAPYRRRHKTARPVRPSDPTASSPAPPHPSCRQGSVLVWRWTYLLPPGSMAVYRTVPRIQAPLQQQYLATVGTRNCLGADRTTREPIHGYTTCRRGLQLWGSGGRCEGSFPPAIWLTIPRSGPGRAPLRTPAPQFIHQSIDQSRGCDSESNGESKPNQIRFALPIPTENDRLTEQLDAVPSPASPSP